MARSDYGSGSPRAAHHPEQQDPPRGRARSRPGTRSAAPLDRAILSTPSAVVLADGAVDCATVALTERASSGPRPPATGSPSRLWLGCVLRACASWPVEGRPKLREDPASGAMGVSAAASSCRPTARVSSRGNALCLMWSGSDAIGTEHGRRLSHVGQRGWLLHAIARTGHLRRFRCLIATGGTIVRFTSLDRPGAGGPG